jgi:hypothetical protein
VTYLKSHSTPGSGHTHFFCVNTVLSIESVAILPLYLN